MRISIVNGFFLPVPPVRGGSTEKSWHDLAREFAQRGHDVVSLSRRWPGFPNRECTDGVHHLRLPGSHHRSALPLNILLDLQWSWRVTRALPAGDIVVCNTLAAPIWLPRLRPDAGRVVVVSGRMPKGQYRLYGSVSRVYAVSAAVEPKILRENPRLQPVIKRLGYPIDWSGLAAPRSPSGRPPTIGYVGRLHVEKGLTLLARALRELARLCPQPWRMVLVGPVEVDQGGSGRSVVDAILRPLQEQVPDRIEVLAPVFDARSLQSIFRQLDVFCYPSLAEHGETFGVSVAEAMAAGAVPVVSRLPCFADFLIDGSTGYTFDHRAADAHLLLARQLARAISDPVQRGTVGQAAQRAVQRYDRPILATRVLDDFATLIPPSDRA